jgi:hypothetical protein
LPRSWTDPFSKERARNQSGTKAEVARAPMQKKKCKLFEEKFDERRLTGVE